MRKLEENWDPVFPILLNRHIRLRRLLAITSTAIQVVVPDAIRSFVVSVVRVISINLVIFLPFELKICGLHCVFGDISTTIQLSFKILHYIHYTRNCYFDVLAYELLLII